MTDFRITKELTGIEDEEILLDFADIEEAVRLGLAKPVFTLPGKAVLALIDDNTYILSSADDESAIKLLSFIPKDGFCVLCVHGEKAIEHAVKTLGFKGNDTLYSQFVYPGGEEDISVHMRPSKGYSLEVRHPGEEVFPQVLANYDLVPEDDLRKDFQNECFLGGFADGEFACFIGLHPEGAMGLLRVFPQFRRRGYAEIIYSTLIYNQLKRGALPYCHVDVTNEASIRLQNKLGFVKAKKPVAWLYRE